MMRTYSELMSLKTFEERFEYLKIGDGKIGTDTFGSFRWINQKFYKSTEYRKLRRAIIIRDSGCDLAIPGRNIHDAVYIHHINPICKEDILEGRDCIFDPENLICTSFLTHNAIHFGDLRTLPTEFKEREPYDTCPWRK